MYKRQRLVCVGWIESYVKSNEKREYLFDLDAGSRSLLAKHGRSDDLDLIFKILSNNYQQFSPSPIGIQADDLAASSAIL